MIHVLFEREMAYPREVVAVMEMKVPTQPTNEAKVTHTCNQLPLPPSGSRVTTAATSFSADSPHCLYGSTSTPAPMGRMYVSVVEVIDQIKLMG